MEFQFFDANKSAFFFSSSSSRPPSSRLLLLFFFFSRSERERVLNVLTEEDYDDIFARVNRDAIIFRVRFSLLETAMRGEDCVAIASDNRLGINQQQTTAVDFKKVFQIHPRLFIGMSGLASDMHTLAATFDFKHKLYELRENRVMEPKVFASVVSTTLYEKRFGPYYVEPVVAGLDKENKPYITGMDLIGAAASTDNFVVAGNNTESLFGVCESMYRENLKPAELFEVISQCLLSGSGRDCLSGWGGTVYLITKDGCEIKSIKGRMD